MRLIDTAVKLVSTMTGGELDLDDALRVPLSSGRRGRDTDFLNGISLWLDDGEEPVRAFQKVILNVNAIKRDIEHGLWQSIDGRRSGTAGGCRAGQKEYQVQRIT